MADLVQLVRKNLRQSLAQARDSAHPGLLIQRGWTDFVKTDASNAGDGGKTEHIRRICDILAPEHYRHAFKRWLAVTAADKRFARYAMKIDGRLLVGLSGGGALETGCAVSHTHGMPFLPGSSIKGGVRAWAEKALSGEVDIRRQIFGTEPTDDEVLGLSGLIAFHDAWWIPDSGSGSHKNKPFAEEVVTPHHSDYYANDGKIDATDLDSPVPNAMIGVRGSFLFTLEGDVAWLKLARSMLEKALVENGIGAKTAAGYGYMSPDIEANNRFALEAEEARRAGLSAEDRIVAIVASLNEKQIAEHFGTDINNTRAKYGENFELLAGLVKARFAASIDQWSTETKKTHNARHKAYRFFSGKGESK